MEWDDPLREPKQGAAAAAAAAVAAVGLWGAA